jgi:hypothetical protein
MSIYPWASEPAQTDIVKLSETNWRHRQELCVKAFIDALRRLSPGFILWFSMTAATLWISALANAAECG